MSDVIDVMSTPRLATIAILGLTSITAAGLAYHQYRRAEALTAQLAQVQKIASVRAKAERPAVSTSPSATDEGARPQLSDLEGDFAPPPEPEGPPDRDRRGGDRGDMSARFEKLMADPEFAAAFQAQQRAALDGRYADLFKSLNLPPAELDQLKGLLAEKQNAIRDVMMAARSEGLGRENRDELRELVELTRSEIDAEISALIGDQGLAQIENYEQTAPQRATVSRLETRLSYTATPLNSAQSEALVNILTQNPPLAQIRGSSSNGGPSFGGGGDRPVPITDDTLARAQAVLAPDQLQVLAELQAEQRASQTISAAFRSSFRPEGRDQAPPQTSSSRGPGG